MEVLRHPHEHPGKRDTRRPPAATTRSTPTSCTATTPPRPRHRRDQRRRDREGDGPAEPRRPGRSARAGSWPRTSPPTSPPGPVSSAATTSRTCATPSRTRSAGSGTCLPPRPPRPQTHPQDQPGLAVEGRVPDLLAAALPPARTQLTRINHPSSTEGGPTRRGRSRCAPGHTGQPRPPPRRSQTDMKIKNRHPHNQ
jgi:hypothetical protein